MHTYVKLKDGTIWILWSDNQNEETMLIYSLDEKDSFDVEWDRLHEVNYSEVEITDTNLFCLK